MTEGNILEDLKNAIIEMDDEKAISTANALIAQGIDPLKGIENGLSEGMVIIGERFNRMECFLPELIRAANTFNLAVKVLEKEITKCGGERETSGIIVLGTVKGDIHKIGKDIVALLMKTRGFEIIDLGEDVQMSTFVDKALEYNADIIAMSALLTSTMHSMKDVIELLKLKGIRDQFSIMVGGGPVSAEFAEEIGSDGYAETAEEAVNVAVKLIQGKG